MINKLTLLSVYFLKTFINEEKGPGDRDKYYAIF